MKLVDLPVRTVRRTSGTSTSTSRELARLRAARFRLRHPDRVKKSNARWEANNKAQRRIINQRRRKVKP